MTTDEAIEIVARWAAAQAVDGEYSTTAEWENYPEIGEYHWRRIRDWLDDIAPDVPGEAFAEAYAHLTRLAAGDS